MIYFLLVYDCVINFVCFFFLLDLYVILENYLGCGNFMRIYYKIYYCGVFVGGIF